MNKIVGFVRISKDAKTCKGAKNPSEFIGNVCRVVEFGHDDCVMVLNPESTALAMFDKEDVQQSFKCGYVNGVITPPNLDYISEIAYYTKAISRKVSKDKRKVLIVGKKILLTKDYFINGDARMKNLKVAQVILQLP